MSSPDELESTTLQPDAQVLCLDAEDLQNVPGFAALVNAWTSQRSTALAPDADTFDLIEIARYLEEAVRLSVNGTDAAIFKFVGPAVCARLQGDPTGTNLFDYIRHLPIDAAGIIRQAFATPAGIYIVFEITYKSGRLARNRGLYLPLLSTTKGDNHLMGMQATGSTVKYDTASSTTVIATRLVQASWVDVGAGVPTIPLLG